MNLKDVVHPGFYSPGKYRSEELRKCSSWLRGTSLGSVVGDLSGWMRLYPSLERGR